MRRFLLDSNAVSDCIFRRRNVDERVREARRRGDRIGTGIPVIAELLGGIEASSTRNRNLPVFNRNLNLFRIWPFDLKAAREYSRIYAELRRRGIQIQSIDVMIAAIALTQANCRVVTTDSDLAKIPTLEVENWAT